VLDRPFMRLLLVNNSQDIAEGSDSPAKNAYAFCCIISQYIQMQWIQYF